MEQVAWAALGVLAAGVFGTLGAVFYLSSSLGARIDSLGAKIDAQGARLDARIDSLSGLLIDHIQSHRAG